MMRWNSAKTYTEEDMLRMQQEAVDRVREFQQRSREATGPSWAEPTQPEPFLHSQPLPLEPVAEEGMIALADKFSQVAGMLLVLCISAAVILTLLLGIALNDPDFWPETPELPAESLLR